MLEVKRNLELNTALVKSSSRLPLAGSRLKRGPDQMEDALEPAKVRYVWRAESQKWGRDKKTGHYGTSSLSLPRNEHEAWVQ